MRRPYGGAHGAVGRRQHGDSHGSHGLGADNSRAGDRRADVRDDPHTQNRLRAHERPVEPEVGLDTDTEAAAEQERMLLELLHGVAEHAHAPPLWRALPACDPVEQLLIWCCVLQLTLCLQCLSTQE